MHPRIAADSVRVRFTGYGEWALNVEVFALADTAEAAEFLAIQEDVLLQVMDVVREAGCDFAFPSQTQYLAAESAIDADRSRRAEEAVREWRGRDGLRAAGFLDARPRAAGPVPQLHVVPRGTAAA
jgi:MscS family membrane protein